MIARTFFVAVIALCLVFAALLAVTRISRLRTEVDADSPVQRNELLRAPGFDDVSALDDLDIARNDAWLREQVALAEYANLETGHKA